MPTSGIWSISKESLGWGDVSGNTFICYEENEGCVYIIFNNPVKYVKQIYFKLKMYENYPFAKPGIAYGMDLENWKEMRKFYGLYNEGMVDRFKRVTGLECMCCVSIICGDNWNVHIKMKDIADELRKFMIIKERMYERLISSIISNKEKKIRIELPDDVWNYIREYI